MSFFDPWKPDDPVEVGAISITGKRVPVMPKVNQQTGSASAAYTYELFRGQLAWHRLRGQVGHGSPVEAAELNWGLSGTTGPLREPDHRSMAKVAFGCHHHARFRMVQHRPRLSEAQQRRRHETLIPHLSDTDRTQGRRCADSHQLRSLACNGGGRGGIRIDAAPRSAGCPV